MNEEMKEFSHQAGTDVALTWIPGESNGSAIR